MDTDDPRQDAIQQFRARLSAVMVAQKISRAGLARAVGVDRSSVSQLLDPARTRMPNGLLVARLARQFGVSSDWLLGLSDAPESAGDVLSSAMTMPAAERALVDAEILRWHAEASGTKIRHVPATLPDMLKTSALLRWDLSDPDDTPEVEQRVDTAREKLRWMHTSENDYEVALPLSEVRALVQGAGYYTGLHADARREQLLWMADMTETLYPSLRMFLFDMKQVYSAPMTIFGVRLGAIYLGQNYLAFRDRDRVRALIDHFDGLIVRATVSARAIPETLREMAQDVSTP
jgi:transcriptional regulator with XRE-family HTH domain